MAKEVIWTPEAERSFESVLDYLQDHWTHTDIVKFIEKTDSVIRQIQRFPLSYRNAGKEDFREAIVSRHNILLYRVTGKLIYLLYFWDTRKNPAKRHI